MSFRHDFLTLFRMGIFGAAQGWGRKGPPPTKNLMMKLSTVIPYLKKIQKIYESLEFLIKTSEFC